MYHRLFIIFVTGFILFVPVGPLWSGLCFLDPGIPHGETVTYESKSNGGVKTIKETAFVVSDGITQVYEIRSYSPTLDAVIKINKQNMSILSLHLIRKYPDATIDSTLTMVSQAENSKEDEIKIPHFLVLKYLLRGFPFGERKKMKINYYGEERSKNFLMSAKYKKQESIKVKGKTINCYKLEFGLDGFWGTFLPELEFWYSVEPPHYLVKYEGVMGSPGAPESNVVLTEDDIASHDE